MPPKTTTKNNQTLVYCKDCSSRNSWERYPGKDWLAESGNVLGYAYRCNVCGAVTIRPQSIIKKESTKENI